MGEVVRKNLYVGYKVRLEKMKVNMLQFLIVHCL